MGVKVQPWDRILEYWFGKEDSDARVAETQSGLWWKKHPEVDADIRDRFANDLEAAAGGRHDDWLVFPRGRLALIILADQFPRNIYRGSRQSFAYDAHALRWCKQGLDAGADRELRVIERVFFYLPLEHSEAIADQHKSVELFSRLAQSVPSGMRGLFDGYVDYAQRHREIIERFGRFPHRNDILGRESTAEEIDFLQQPGSSF